MNGFLQYISESIDFPQASSLGCASKLKWYPTKQFNAANAIGTGFPFAFDVLKPKQTSNPTRPVTKKRRCTKYPKVLHRSEEERTRQDEPCEGEGGASPHNDKYNARG